MLETNEALNLKYVSEVIGNDWKSWKLGDVVCINTQTGTGKTFFITGNKSTNGLVDTLEEDEKIIYICNRIALKQQNKLDLLKKFDEKIPKVIDDNGNETDEIDYYALEKITVIRNITICSYHAIAYGEQQRIFLTKDASNSLDSYKYIICDEAHFIFTDAAYMNKANLVFFKIIRSVFPKSILLFISATIDEVLPTIEKSFKDSDRILWGMDVNQLHKYSTGTDYSYLDVKYFKYEKDLVSLLSNDKSEDKWLVFVTSSRHGKKIKEDLDEQGIDSVFIKSGTVNDETKSIVDTGKFNCKVLISTKVLDNGVNIIDSDVKNLVVCAYDKTTFIQEIGRLRINIRNPRKIKLFIKAMNKKVFMGRLEEVYQPKLDILKLYYNDNDKFKLMFNMDVNKVYADLFYLDDDNKWKVNTAGHVRLQKDIDFAQEMIALFDIDKYAFIKEQLTWLKKEYEFDERNLIVDVVNDADVNELSQFLENACNNEDRLEKNTFTESIMNIISKSPKLNAILSKIDSKHKNRNKGIKTFNNLFDKCNLPYAIISKRSTINKQKSTKWIVGYINDDE